MTGSPGLVVAILATSGEDGLTRSLDAFGPVAHRLVVVDPLGRASSCGATVLDLAAARANLTATSVFAVVEGEVASRRLRAALEASGSVGAHRRACVALRHIGLGWEIETPGACRYGPWSAERFGFGGAASPEPPAVLPGALVREHGDVDGALHGLDAIAAALAAVLDDADAPISVARSLAAGLGTGLRALTARAPRSIGWGRWIGAALLAYSEVLVRVKVLERRGRA